ncbi:MAG: XRE family transcriptional regulator [Candidatus Omnitrophica bacterium]|nr:XRE family transcriptional regulator [Candidatus Omnitrophota bacterium]MDD5671572.1 XRE family transcriptional regulator [Candidatus Omnitrophota bacterium]
MLKNLGERMRKLRKEKGITLIELSKKTGVAQATLSRIETGVMMGTVESHELIAEALGIGLAELYSGVDRRYEQISHLKSDTERNVTRQTKDLRIELLTQESSKKKITPLLLTLKGNGQTQRESNERGVEKFVMVLEGEVKVKVDQEEFSLKNEETLYFDASLPHQITNESSSQARLLMAVSPSKI